MDETLSTLRFASSVKKIKTAAKINELDPEEPELVLQTIQEELAALKDAAQIKFHAATKSLKEELAVARLRSRA